MRLALIGFLSLSSLQSWGSANISNPECKITNYGDVFLVVQYQAQHEQSQQMVVDVGQETWKDPTHAREKCEALKTTYTTFVGEKWLPKVCICTNRSTQYRVIVFKNSKGQELHFFAHNRLDFRDATDINPLFSIYNDNDPDCRAAPDPMCGF